MSKKASSRDRILRATGESHSSVLPGEASQPAAFQTVKADQAAGRQTEPLDSFTSLPTRPSGTAVANSSPGHGQLTSSELEADKSFISRLGSWWQPAAGAASACVFDLHASQLHSACSHCTIFRSAGPAQATSDLIIHQEDTGRSHWRAASHSLAGVCQGCISSTAGVNVDTSGICKAFTRG